MPRRKPIGPDDDGDDLIEWARLNLLDSRAAAAVMGFTGDDAVDYVNVVAHRNPDDWPAPVIVVCSRCKLYRRSDIEAFLEDHPEVGSRGPRRRPSKETT